MRYSIWTASAAAIALSGCTSITSFAPPPVTKTTKVAEYDAACTPSGATFNGQSIAITPDVIGASDLIDNYQKAYECTATELANGRQVFEVPVFLATAAGLAGAQFGLDADGILATGVYSALVKGGGDYYAPEEKASMVWDAHRAVGCVRDEASGLSYFRTSRPSQEGSDTPDAQKIADLQADGARIAQTLTDLRTLAPAERSPQIITQELTAQTNLLALANAIAAERMTGSDRTPPPATVSISAERQYYNMIYGALTDIHEALGRRLGAAGLADASDVFDELKRLAEESAERDDAAETADGDADNAEDAARVADAQADQAEQTAQVSNLSKASHAQADAATAQFLRGRASDLARDATRERAEAVRLETLALQPKIDACILVAEAA